VIIILFNVSTPTYSNAVELSSFIQDKRKGKQMTYNDNTNPTLREVNERLMASENIISRVINTSYNTEKTTEEISWNRILPKRSQFQRGYRSTYNEPKYEYQVSLLYHPITEVKSITIYRSRVACDLVADYEEGWGKDYYIDYINGIIFFYNAKPDTMSPMSVEYTYGNREDIYGRLLDQAYLVSIESNNSLKLRLNNPIDGLFNGKLIKIGDSTYRVYESHYVSGYTQLNLSSSNHLLTDELTVFAYGYQGLGIEVESSTATGLSDATKYYFKINGTEYDITTGISNDYDHLITLINAKISSIGSCSLIDGDLVFTSSVYETEILLSYGTTGTDLFTSLTAFVEFDTAVVQEEGDEVSIYGVPSDISEAVLIYTYLGMLAVDPTYQYNLVNPFEESHPLWEQYNNLYRRYLDIISQRVNTFQLVN
jgi:hypothetical protein